MKRFKDFLIEGGEGKILFGIDPFGKRSQTEVMQFAKNVGYTVEHGPKHIKIINPKTGQLVASLSHGANRNEFNEKYALKNIARDLETSGSQLRPQMPAKTVADRIRSGTQQGKIFPRAAGLPGIAAQVAGEALAAPVQQAGEETGLIDLIARGINAVIPTDILASGPSPAEEERQEQEQDERWKRMRVNPKIMRSLPI